MNEQRIEEQPYDDRHNTPAVPRNPVADGEHIGNDHQEQPIDAGTAFWTQDPRPAVMPSRIQEQSLFNPPPLMPAFGSGLNWLASVQSPIRADLVNFDFGHVGGLGGFDVSNIELRTIYAHLLETAGRVRAEMRERGMQVDI